MFKENIEKCNSFEVTTDLLNSENVKEAFAELCNQLKGFKLSI